MITVVFGGVFLHLEHVVSVLFFQSLYMAIVVYGPAIALEAGNFTVTNINFYHFLFFKVTSWQDKTLKGLPE